MDEDYVIPHPRECTREGCGRWISHPSTFADNDEWERWTDWALNGAPCPECHHPTRKTS